MITFLLIGAAIVAVIAALAVVTRGYERINRLKQQTLRQAVAAEAEIVAIERGDFNREIGSVRSLGLKIVLNVRHPARGAYRAATVWLVDELLIPQIQLGRIVPVLVNRIDAERVYPNCKGMEFVGWKLKKI
jgi:hypothetical protein